MRVSARRGWASEKSNFFGILLEAGCENSIVSITGARIASEGGGIKHLSHWISLTQ